jgi:predicted O-methyltransferase YrrM
LKFIFTRIKIYSYAAFERLLLIKAIYCKEKINFKFLYSNQLKNERAKEMGLLLKKAILKSNKKDIFKILEIGSYLGESTELFGKILEKKKRDFLIISVDPYQSYSTTKDQEINSVANRMSKKINKIYFYFLHNISLQNWKNNFIHIRKNSKEALLLLDKLNLSFDFIYIDGSHYYKDIKNDFILSKKILKKNSNYQGILCGDDYEFESKNYKKLNLTKKEFIKFLNKNIEVDYVSLRKSNGETISFHPGITKFFSEVKDTIQRKNSGFWFLKN